jgi:thiol-disulfide isomerase/thioredoxin
MWIRLPVLACALALVVMPGCGNKDPESNAPSKAEVAQALNGSPPKLQALHNQANQLLGGGKDAFHKRLDDLRGYPVVVNSWGSWCAPCRGEFPVFQKVALKEGKRVAFLGLDAQDNDANARKFLRKFPVTYPSYKDPDVKISNSIRSGSFFPTTVFFDKNGKLVYAHPGPYEEEKDLLTDIRRYAG